MLLSQLVLLNSILWLTLPDLQCTTSRVRCAGHATKCDGRSWFTLDRWLTAAKNAIVGWLLNFRIRMFVKSAILICGPQSTRKRTIFSTRWKMFSFKIFLMVFFSIKSFACWDLKMFKDFSLACCDAPINVNPVKGECGQGVEIWYPRRAFDRAKRPQGREIWLWPTEA